MHSRDFFKKLFFKENFQKSYENMIIFFLFCITGNVTRRKTPYKTGELYAIFNF